MNSTIPADLLELKARFETWRTNRKYLREPIPDELWKIALGQPRLPRAQSRPNANIGQVEKSDWIHFVWRFCQRYPARRKLTKKLPNDILLAGRLGPP